MKPSFLQRGALLIVAIVLVLVIAILVSSLSFMAVSNIGSSGGHLSSAQALYIAESGLQRALYVRGASGATTCGTLAETRVVGEGSFTNTGTPFTPAATTLSAAITAAASSIPATSVTGYATHGRISIDSEEINYAGTSTTVAGCAPVSAPCFTGASRGMGGTAAAGHLSAATVRSQPQCTVRSTGTANTGVRTLETAAAPPYSAFLDAPAVTVDTAATTLGTLNTALPAGDKIILAVVTFKSAANGTNMAIAAGNLLTPGAGLQLRRGTTALAFNQSIILVEGDLTPDANDFPQKTHYLLYWDRATAANPSYDVISNAATYGGAARASAKVQLLVINVARSCATCFFPTGAPANVLIGTTATTLATLNTAPLPAGDNIVIAAVQLNNTVNAGRSTLANNLRLNRTGLAAALATNVFDINLAASGLPNSGKGLLLLGRDANAPADSIYTVTAMAITAASTNGEAKIIAFNSLRSAYASSVNATSLLAVAPGTSMVGVTTTLAAGENVVIAANQYDNNEPGGGAGRRNIEAGVGGAATAVATGIGERIVFGGTNQSFNPFSINLCSSSASIFCNDFSSGLIWRQPFADANQIYSVFATASPSASATTGIRFFSQLLVIHVNSPPTLDWQEIYP